MACKDMSLGKEIWDETRNYQNSLVERETSVLSSSLAVFLGSGAKPPKKPQNSPVSASAINFPSSMWKGQIIKTQQAIAVKLSNIESPV